MIVIWCRGRAFSLKKSTQGKNKRCFISCLILFLTNGSTIFLSPSPLEPPGGSSVYLFFSSAMMAWQNRIINTAHRLICGVSVSQAVVAAHTYMLWDETDINLLHSSLDSELMGTPWEITSPFLFEMTNLGEQCMQLKIDFFFLNSSEELQNLKLWNDFLTLIRTLTRTFLNKIVSFKI